MNTIESASHSLSGKYYHEPWYVSCGVTGPSASDRIQLMVTRKAPHDVKSMTSWEGYKVSVIVSGKVIARPASHVAKRS